jgi:hypothetical protein
MGCAWLIDVFTDRLERHWGAWAVHPVLGPKWYRLFYYIAYYAGYLLGLICLSSISTLHSNNTR